jgi:hypothetical protein
MVTTRLVSAFAPPSPAGGFDVRTGRLGRVLGLGEITAGGCFESP